MIRSSEINKQIEISKQVEVFIYRAPRQNHEAMVQINEQFKNFFSKHGALKFEVFTLNNKENIMDFVNLSKTI